MSDDFLQEYDLHIYPELFSMFYFFVYTIFRNNLLIFQQENEKDLE